MAVVWKKIAFAADVSTEIDGDITTHNNNTTTAHGAVSAATASKHVVRDASARAKFAQAAAAGDVIVADANVRAPNSTLLEGSSKATVQNHTPKAHTLASHSTKAHSELTGVTSDLHHAQAHTAASHSDQGATGAELETLTDGSETALHSHAGNGNGSTVVWKDVSERALADTARTVTLGFTDLDLTAYTSADAKIAIIRFFFATVTCGTAVINYLQIRKNGTTPDHRPLIAIHHQEPDGVERGLLVLCGMDAGQVIEYSIIVATNATISSYIDVLGYIE